MFTVGFLLYFIVLGEARIRAHFQCIYTKSVKLWVSKSRTWSYNGLRKMHGESEKLKESKGR